MASLVKNLRLLANLNSKIYTNTAQRTLFTPSALGLDGFKKVQERTEIESASNLETFKKRVEDSLKENKAILTEDLKTLIYLTRNENDIGLLVNALKHSKTQQTVKIKDFSFGAPLMRLLYSLNKTDHAIKLYEDPELAHVFTDQTSLLLLANKLNEEKRYADTIRLVLNAIENSPAFKDKFNPTLTNVMSDVQKILAEALYNLNNKDAVEQSKRLFKILATNPQKKPARDAVANSILLAVNQNEIEYAYELLSLLDGQNPIAKNLKAIILARLNRNKEALDVANILIDSRDALGRPADVFPLTMKTLRETVEKSQDKALIECLESLSKKVVAMNRLSAKDIIDITQQLVSVRMGPAQRAQRNGGMGGGGYNRGDGFRDQQRGGFRDGGDGFSFNRQPRGDSGFGFNRQQRDGGEQGGGFGFNRQQGSQNVGGYNRAPRGEMGGRFEQGQQQFGSRFGDRSTQQRTAPPRRQQNNDDDD